MTWPGRTFFVLGAASVGALFGVVEPYWDSVTHSEDTVRGRLAREERANDTAEDAMGRAVLGGALGLVFGLLGFTIRNYRTDPSRRLHWTGLEIRKK